MSHALAAATLAVLMIGATASAQNAHPTANAGREAIAVTAPATPKDQIAPFSPARPPDSQTQSDASRMLTREAVPATSPPPPGAESRRVITEWAAAAGKDLKTRKSK